MADRQAKVGRMVAVSILVILFINVLTSNAATPTEQIAPEVTSGSMQQPQNDDPQLPWFCQYIQPCSESNCNPPNVCAVFYKKSVCCQP